MLRTKKYSASYTNDSLFKEVINEIFDARELGRQLFIRDYKAMYRQSFLGYFWAFIPPVFTSLIWIVLRNSNAVQIPESGIPYAVFVIIGTMLWQTFADGIQNTLRAVAANKPTLIKINFSRVAIIVSAFYTTIVNFSVKLLIILVILILFNIQLSWLSLLFFVGGFSLIILGMSIGILLSPIGLLYTDIAKGIPIFLQFFMYLTPVIYPEPRIGNLNKLMFFNPVSPLLNASRDWLVGIEYHSLVHFAIVSGLALSLTFIGLVMYKVSMPIIIERVGS